MKKEKYTWFYNEADEFDFTIIHTEGEKETTIALTDSAEKADFITKACNQFSLEKYEADKKNPNDPPRQVKIEKLTELPEARHRFNIEVGYTRVGDFISEPKIDVPFYIGRGWRTSVVTEIIDESTFKTMNSIYRWTIITPTHENNN